MWKELELASKNYVGKISLYDVKYLMIQQIESFHFLCVSFMRDCLMDILDLSYYKMLEKTERFSIQSGEYYDLCDYIHIECKNKDYDYLRKWLFKEEEEDAYWFEDFREIHLENVKVKDLELNYVDFHGAKMKQVKFINCNLEGAKFQNSVLESVEFIDCDLEKTEFEGSLIKD